MKISKQQKQTLNVFRSEANKWQYKSTDNASYNFIENRNKVALDVILNKPRGSNILDVGCGTGQLVVKAAKSRYKAMGIDFSKEMISECINNMKTENPLLLKRIDTNDLPYS